MTRVPSGMAAIEGNVLTLVAVVLLVVGSSGHTEVGLCCIISARHSVIYMHNTYILMHINYLYIITNHFLVVRLLQQLFAYPQSQPP